MSSRRYRIDAILIQVDRPGCRMVVDKLRLLCYKVTAA